MPVRISPKPIIGDSDDNIIMVNHAAADAIFGESGNGYQAWSRNVDGRGGNDMIFRDRPGDYVESANFYFNYSGFWANHDLLGNVLLQGGTGTDTVSYSAFSSAMDIDLRPVAQQTAGEPVFWESYADISGMAKIRGEANIEIHGHDYLHSIENAIGTQYNDLIQGTDGANRLQGLGGNDVLKGFGGNDFLQGGDDNDHVLGGTGHDTIEGGDGNDRLHGEDGNDGITGGDGNDRINGGDGNDIMAGGLGNDILRGGDDDDFIYGGGGNDRAYGENGNDHIYLQGSGGWAYGGAGDDSVYGGEGDDVLNTGKFTEGQDEAFGGNGDDTLVIGLGDTADGGAGTDRVIFRSNLDDTGLFRVVIHEDGNGVFNWVGGGSRYEQGTLNSIESLTTGSSDDEFFISDNGANSVNSGAGDDFVLTAGGDDYVLARQGDDEVIAGSGDDTVYSGSGDDRVDGGTGADYINGGSGDDTIIGGLGDDELVGGGGADGFVWKDGDHGLDTITDFVIGTDYIGIQDYLQSPVHMGGSYVGKVFGLETHDGSATVLTAKTDAGWKSFARLEGLEVEEVWAAIQNGSLFAGDPGIDGPGGFETRPSMNETFDIGTQDLAVDMIQMFETDCFAFI